MVSTARRSRSVQPRSFLSVTGVWLLSSCDRGRGRGGGHGPIPSLPTGRPGTRVVRHSAALGPDVLPLDSRRPSPACSVGAPAASEVGLDGRRAPNRDGCTTGCSDLLAPDSPQLCLADETAGRRVAALFAAALLAFAIVLMLAFVNPLAAALTVVANVFYVVVYTVLLKRRTSQNIVWGGVAGCLPTLIGWAAVTGSLAWPPVLLFLVVFFWTPPHYWPLAMRFRDDYARAGVPMLPVVASAQVVAAQILAYSWAMVITTLALWRGGALGWVYGGVGAPAGGWVLAGGRPPPPRRGGAG